MTPIFQVDAKAISDAIRKFNDQIKQDFDWYVAIARGGLVPAGLLAQITGQPKIDTLCIQSYQGKKKGDIFHCHHKPFPHITGKRVLVVDDLIDTGETMEKALYFLGCWHPDLIETAVIYKKSCAGFHPTYYAEPCPQERWITFPWEAIPA